MYDKIEEIETQLIEALISEIQIYEEQQPNGQWLKSIKFKLPIIEEDMTLCLDDGQQVETVVLLTREKNIKSERKAPDNKHKQFGGNSKGKKSFSSKPYHKKQKGAAS